MNTFNATGGKIKGWVNGYTSCMVAHCYRIKKPFPGKQQTDPLRGYRTLDYSTSMNRDTNVTNSAETELIAVTVKAHFDASAIE